LSGFPGEAATHAANRIADYGSLPLEPDPLIFPFTQEILDTNRSDCQSDVQNRKTRAKQNDQMAIPNGLLDSAHAHSALV
jgi:hypothetical protein